MYIAAPPTLPIACQRCSPVSSSIQPGNAVILHIQAVLSFVPFQPHGIYNIYMFEPGKQGEIAMPAEDQQ